MKVGTKAGSFTPWLIPDARVARWKREGGRIIRDAMPEDGELADGYPAPLSKTRAAYVARLAASAADRVAESAREIASVLEQSEAEAPRRKRAK